MVQQNCQWVSLTRLEKTAREPSKVPQKAGAGRSTGNTTGQQSRRTYRLSCSCGSNVFDAELPVLWPVENRTYDSVGDM